MAIGKQVFTLKTYGPKLYKWSPDNSKNPPPKQAQQRQNSNAKPFYCDALASSQGQDWIVTYVYDISVSVTGQVSRLAYVECDYVE